jgi:hypothetical protein
MAAMAMKIMKNGVNERNISRREMKMASASMAAGSVASAKALRHRWQSVCIGETWRRRNINRKSSVIMKNGGNNGSGINNGSWHQ